MRGVRSTWNPHLWVTYAVPHRLGLGGPTVRRPLGGTWSRHGGAPSNSVLGHPEHPGGTRRTHHRQTERASSHLPSLVHADDGEERETAHTVATLPSHTPCSTWNTAATSQGTRGQLARKRVGQAPLSRRVPRETAPRARRGVGAAGLTMGRTSTLPQVRRPRTDRDNERPTRLRGDESGCRREPAEHRQPSGTHRWACHGHVR